MTKFVFFFVRLLVLSALSASICGVFYPVLAQDRVTIQMGFNGPSFTLDGRVFVPIGVNYLQQHLGPPYQSFNMFDAQSFDRLAINRNLSAIAAEGFNVVRLWLKGFDPDNGFDCGPKQISDTYVGNVLSSLQLAKRHGLRVILTGSFRKDVWLPKNYLPESTSVSTDEVGGMNRLIMLPQMAEGLGQFYYDLLKKIGAQDPESLDTIFYMDLYNELHFDLLYPPFSAKSGGFTYEGKRYDLSSGVSRQNLMDNAAEAWLRAVGARVKEAAPNLLITASSFYLASRGSTIFDGGITAQHGTVTSPYPLSPRALIKGGARILDIHTYPSPSRPGMSAFHVRAPAIMKAEGLSTLATHQVPVIAGEFGTSESGTQADALAELAINKTTLCRYHFSGYVVWSWMDGVAGALPANQALADVVTPRVNSPFCGRAALQQGSVSVHANKYSWGSDAQVGSIRRPSTCS